MTEGQRTRGGLTARIVRVTLLIGVVTLVSAGIVAMISTSRLAIEKSRTRDLVATHVVEDRVESRLRTAATIVAQSAEVAVDTEGAPLDREIRAYQLSNRDLISELLVVDAAGQRVAGVAETATAGSLSRSGVLAAALSGSTIFVSEQAPSAFPRIWLLRTTLTDDRRLLVVLARLNVSLFADVVNQTVDVVDNGVVALLRGETPVLAAGQYRDLRLRNARWTPTGSRSGSVTFTGPDGTPMSGHYDQVQGLEGLDWRVVVCEPVAGAAVETLRAVAPSLAVLLFGGAVSLVLAWGLARRIAQPLRELERTARTAAVGSYVKPLSMPDDDEIGRVAAAFNDVALRLNALHDLSQLLASASQLDQVLDGILLAMGHIIGPGSSSVYLLRQGEPILDPVRCKGAALAHAAPVDVRRRGWLATALDGIDPVVFTVDGGDLEEEIPGISGRQDAVLVAPLVVGHDALGVVVVLLADSRELSEAEREMVRTFSAQAAVAVRNSRLFEVESESRRIAEALRAVAEALVRPLGLSSALHEVESIVREMLQATDVVIAIVDRSALGLPEHPEPDRESAVLGIGLRALAENRTMGPVRVWRGSDRSADALLESSDAEELLVVPIALENDHGAVMAILMPGVGAGQEVINTLQALADEIELALDNAYFYERAIARAANLETMFRISQVVSGSLQINVVLNRVLDVVQKILAADAVAMLMYDRQKKRLTTSMARGQIPASLLQLDLAPGEDVPGHVFVSGEPVMLDDLYESMDGLAGAAAVSSLRSLLAVPLVARGRSIGVLMVFSAISGAFTEEDMGVLQTFGAQAALALDTADLYSREHEVASVLQRSIVPGALPEFEEVDTASIYHPAGGDAEIGGDYYDIFRAQTGEIWMAMGDVCGKGVGAATKTSMIKYSVRSLVAAGLDPAAVMSEVNRMASETGEPSDIVTLWLGFYDETAGVLTWADGGHPPGLMRRADGDIEQLGPTGPLLGAIPMVGYTSETIPMHPGDTLLLYTDGVTEARQGNIFFGERRLVNVLSEGGTPDQLARRLLVEVSDFASTEMRDDIAVLVVAATKRMREEAKESD